MSKHIDPEHSLYKTPDGFAAVASHRKGKKLHQSITDAMSGKIKVGPSRVDPEYELKKDSEGRPYMSVIRDPNAKKASKPDTSAPTSPKDPAANADADGDDKVQDAPIVNYGAKTVDELKKLCTERSIEFKAKATKGELVEALFIADEADNEEGDAGADPEALAEPEEAKSE